MDVINEIIAERKRQIEVVGYDAAHDDGHQRAEMAMAAACYVYPRGITQRYREQVPLVWPWAKRWWKPEPGSRRRELIKGAALIVAEIERLDRAREAGR